MLGLPCVASNAMGIPSLIDDKRTGMLYKSGDYNALAAMVKVMGRNVDLGGAAFNAARERHDRDRILNDLLNAYETIVGKG